MLDLPIGCYLIPETGYSSPDRIECTNDPRSGQSWAVRSNGMCLSRSLEWDHEPRPSSSLRTAEWYYQHRWDSAEEAYSAWKRWSRRQDDDGR
jgi:hypothetical protein